MDYIFIEEETEFRAVIKKSIFTAYIKPINNEEDAKNLIENIRKNNKDVGHVAYAYNITDVVNNKPNTTSRYSDDGEPSKTAGFPIQQLIERHSITNTIIAVSRVFGGTLLGTAGLIRAYGGAAGMVFRNAKTIKRPLTTPFYHSINIKQLSKAKAYIKNNNLTHKEEFFGENVNLTINIPINTNIKEEFLSNLS